MGFFLIFFKFFSLEQHLKSKEMGREMGYGRGGYHIYIYIYHLQEERPFFQCFIRRFL